MQISFNTLLMTAAWSSLFILVLALLRRPKGKNGFFYHNLTPLFIFLLGCLVRCVLPLEFPGFTQNITSKPFTQFDEVLHTPVASSDVLGVSLLLRDVLLIVWAGGALLLWFRFLKKYWKDMYYLGIRGEGIYTEVSSGPIRELAETIAGKQKIKRFRVFQDPSIDVPKVCGLLYPRVLLPEGGSGAYSEDELRYVLSHELAHWKSGDVFVRFITVLICYLFWWNPVSYLLLYRLEETLEFRCDAAVIASGCVSDEERLTYLDAILHAVEHKRRCKQKRRAFALYPEMACPMSAADFQRRVDIIGDYVPNRRKERRAAVITAVLVCAALVLSYSFIFEPCYEPPKEDIEEPGYHESLPENTYLVEEPDGSFSVYYNGTYSNTVSSESAEMMAGDGFEILEK